MGEKFSGNFGGQPVCIFRESRAIPVLTICYILTPKILRGIVCYRKNVLKYAACRTYSKLFGNRHKIFL